MKIFLILCFSLTVFSGYGQIQKGIVKDASGIAIENAYIVNKNSQSHAHSNEFGSFSIDKTNPDEVLEISALGYKKANFTLKIDDALFVLENDI